MVALARRFFKLTVLYLVFSACWVFIFVDEPLPFFENNLNTAAVFLQGMLRNTYIRAGMIAAVVLAWAFHRKNGESGLELVQVAMISLVGITFSMAGLASIKSAFPEVISYYADHYFFSADRWLLLGNDAWRIAHNLVPEIKSSWVDIFYFWTWIPLSSLPPFFLLLFDRNRERVARYILLFLCSSFVLGNALALVGLSVGPVYYDAYYGVSAFQALSDALAASGVRESHVGQIQQYLGALFYENDQHSMSEIAAFPSVHVSAIMVAVLYAVERSRIIGAVMVLYAAIIWFLSVYSGYHWMVDGLASILLMVLAQWGLRKSRFPRWLAEGKKPE